MAKHPQQPQTTITTATPMPTAPTGTTGAGSGVPMAHIIGGDHGSVDLPLNDIRVPVTYHATTSFSSENGRFGGVQPSTIPETGTRGSSRRQPKGSEWRHNTPPPPGQGWRGPVRGSGKCLATALEIDYKTLKRRHAMGSLWVRPIDGKTLELWTQSIEDDNRLLMAEKKKKDAAEAAKGSRS